MTSITGVNALASSPSAKSQKAIGYGGHDTYGCGEQDNSYNQRGSVGGFVTDRPLHDEVDAKTASRP